MSSEYTKMRLSDVSNELEPDSVDLKAKLDLDLRRECMCYRFIIGITYLLKILSATLFSVLAGNLTEFSSFARS